MSSSLLARTEVDRDVAHALLNARRAAHGARAPAAHVLVRGLVDEGCLDEERVDVDVRRRRAGVRDRALDELLEHRSARLAGELEELQCLASLTAANEVHYDTSLTRTEPREAGDRLRHHGDRTFRRRVSDCS